MNEEQYLKERVEDQIEWNDKKGIRLKRSNSILSAITTVLSVSLPFVISISQDIASIVSVLGAILLSILNLYHFKEKWINYRTTCELLKAERIYFLTKTGIYTDNPKAFSIFVDRCEKIMNCSLTKWQSIFCDKKQ